MTSSYPALRAQFGSTEYFVTTIPVGELINRIVFADKLDGWENRTIEERFQRKIDMKRVRRDIAPYFANDEKRFSGSLVLAVINDEHMELESLKDVGIGAKIPKLYDDVIGDMGFLIMTGEERLVPLDGQHRAMAFKLAIEGSDEKPKIRPNPNLAKDKVTVILVRFDTEMSRYIFNKINRYAKPTAKADKLITDDDDAVAVITRQMITSGIIPERLVSTGKNALNVSTHEFTTLSTFYDANKLLMDASKTPSLKNPANMSFAERQQRLEELSSEWGRLLSGINLWKNALNNSSKKGDETRRNIRKKYLLGKPIGQLAIIGGYAFTCQRHRDIDRDLLVRRLDQIKWNVRERMWSGVLVHQNGKIMAGKPTAKNASKFIAHLIGAKLTKDEINGLLEQIHGNRSNKTLPEPIQ